MNDVDELLEINKSIENNNLQNNSIETQIKENVNIEKDIKLPLWINQLLYNYNDNQYICNCDAKSLIDNTEIWRKQRLLKQKELELLQEYQINQYKLYNQFQFIGNFYVCNLNDKYILIDGQHRLGSINYLINKKNYKSFNVIIWLINVESEEELITYFQNINKVKPLSLPDLVQDDQRDLINDVANKLFTSFRKVILVII